MAESKVSRKIQIMQTLAEMLEEKTPVKITTAELARRTNITEAAIYRHFPSKRKIYEEMVVFFESNIFPRIETMKQNQSSDEIPNCNKPGYVNLAVSQEKLVCVLIQSQCQPHTLSVC